MSDSQTAADAATNPPPADTNVNSNNGNDQNQQPAADDTTTQSSSSSSPAAAASSSNAASATTAGGLHPLASTWSFWYQPEPKYTGGSPASPAVPGSTMDELKQVESFKTVEEFWSIYHALPSWDNMNVGELFMFFRDPSVPKWECPTLLDGEAITFTTDNMDVANRFIEKMLMAAMGETLTTGQFGGERNVVAGFRVSVRKSGMRRQCRVDVWVSHIKFHPQAEAAVKAIAQAAGQRELYGSVFTKVFHPERHGGK